MEQGAGQAFIHCTASHGTGDLSLEQSRSWGRENKRRGSRLGREVEEIARTATRERFGQGEVADTTDGCALAT